MTAGRDGRDKSQLWSTDVDRSTLLYYFFFLGREIYIINLVRRLTILTGVTALLLSPVCHF